MHAQPESGILIELRLTCLRVIGDLCGEQLTITFNLRRRCISIDDRLHDSSRTKDRGWSECENVPRGATLGFVSFCDCGATGFELPDVMFENRLRDGNQSGNVAVTRARARFDIREVRSATRFRTESEEKQIDTSQGFEPLDVANEFLFEILGVRAHRREAVHLAKEIVAEQPLEIAHEA